MFFPKIVIVVEGGVIQNILTDYAFVGDFYIVDHDDIKERTSWENLDEPIYMDFNTEVDEKEVYNIINMTHRDYLEENDPEILAMFEQEEFERG